jgi:hypothetical protein
MKTFRVVRCWPVDYSSTVEVEAETVEEACRLALEDDDYSDAESCDGSDGPTEIDAVYEVDEDGFETRCELEPEPAGPDLLSELKTVVDYLEQLTVYERINFGDDSELIAINDRILINAAAAIRHATCTDNK